MVERKMLRIAIVLLLALCSSNAYAFYCSEPSAPGSYSKPTPPSEPNTPYCVNTYSNTHTCSDWEIRNYNNAIENYNRELKSYQREVKDYIRKLESYVDDAIEYANCEIKSLK